MPNSVQAVEEWIELIQADGKRTARTAGQEGIQRQVCAAR